MANWVWAKSQVANFLLNCGATAAQIQFPILQVAKFAIIAFSSKRASSLTTHNVTQYAQKVEIDFALRKKQ
jgi:uncharacterized membrane protein